MSYDGAAPGGRDRQRPTTSVLSVLVALIASGCAGDGAGAPAVAVTDSAGVEVVTNLDLEAPAWPLSDAPRLDLGTVGEEGPEQFYRVRDATVLSDGGIAVANAGSQEIRIFGSAGQHRRSFGREGEGPGEFRAIAALRQIVGDSLVVWDARLRRFTVFDPSGALTRSYSIQHEVLNPDILGILADGGAVIGGPWFDFGDDGPSERLVPIYARQMVISPTGELVDTLPRQPYGRFGRTMRGVTVIGRPLFAALLTAAADDGGYWVGTGEMEEVVRYGLDGTVRRIVRWPGAERAVTGELVDTALQCDLEDADPARHAAIRQMYASRPVADRFPPYEEIGVDREGALWVRGWEPPCSEGPSRWMVFAPGGEHLAHVETPARMRVLEIGSDYVIGVALDDFDVEHVQTWGLTRPDAGP